MTQTIEPQYGLNSDYIAKMAAEQLSRALHNHTILPAARLSRGVLKVEGERFAPKVLYTVNPETKVILQFDNEHCVGFVIKDGDVSKAFWDLQERYFDPAINALAESIDDFEQKVLVFGQVPVTQDNTGKQETILTHDNRVCVKVTLAYDSQQCGLKVMLSALTASFE